MPNKEESDEVCVVEEDHPSVTTSDLNEMDKQPSLERVQYSNQSNDSTKQLQSGNDINQPKEQPQKAPPPPSVVVAPIPMVFEEEQDNGKSDANTPTNPDQCCYFLLCGYPNGACPIVMTQVFLAVGLMLCGWAMIDCRFIEATAGFPELYYPEDVTPPQENSPFLPTDQRRGFGLYLNETTNGGCFSDRDSRYWDLEEIENYIDFLGSDWELPRFLASIAVSTGWVAWFILVLFMCCSCVKAMRFLMAAFFLLGAGFQSSAFSVLGSDFCNTQGANCEPARGFWMMVAGIACYVIASLMLAMTKDYPGR